MIKSLAIGAALLALPAAAQPAPPRQCFSVRDIQNVAAQDAFTVNLRVRPNDVFQAKTVVACPDVGFGPALAYRSYSERICSETDLTLVTRSSFGPRDCALQSIRKLTPEETAALPKRARP
jgi:hypothetical protein